MKETRVLDYTNHRVYIGIDVHLKSWDVAIFIDALQPKSFHMKPSAQHLSRYLQRHYPNASYLAAYESGFCGFSVQKKLEQYGIPCIIAHAADIPTSDKEKRHKNDPNDSRKIARSLRAGQLVPIYVPGDEDLAARMLIRHRYNFIKDITRVKNRIKHMFHYLGIAFPDRFSRNRWSGHFISWLEETPDVTGEYRIVLNSHLKQLASLRNQLTQIHKQIRRLAKTEKYEQSVFNLLSIPGIGLISAMTWIVELVDIHRFRSVDKLCGYVGLVPREYSSGDKVHFGSLDKRGNKSLRKTLIQNAWSAIRSDPMLSHRYVELCGRMNANKAIIRIARMLLKRIRFVLVNNQKYQPFEVC
jgi:transposase